MIMCINTYVCTRGRSEDRVRKEDSRQILSSRRTSPLARPPAILLCNARTDVALIIESALGVDMRLVVAIGWIMIFQTFSTQSEQQPPGGVIAGIVVRAGTGEPIAGARVLAQPTTPPRPTQVALQRKRLPCLRRSRPMGRDDLRSKICMPALTACSFSPTVMYVM